MKNNKYYVYGYFDPRKGGEYKFGKYVFEFEPIYIGKGKCGSKRMERHLLFIKDRNIDLTNNKYKLNLFNQIMSDGLEPIFFKIEDKLNEDIAYSIETLLIDLIGFRHNNTGTLTNISVGGFGGDMFTNNPNKEYIRSLRVKQMSGEGNHRFGIKLEDTPSHKMRGENHWNTGREISSSTRKLMSKNNSGKNNPNATKVCKYDLDGKYICTYNTMKEACVENNVNKGCLIRACKSNLKYTAKGFKWGYNNNN